MNLTNLMQTKTIPPNILSWLSVSDWLKLEMINSHWKKIISDLDPIIWRSLCLLKFQLPWNLSPGFKSWKDCYGNNFNLRFERYDFKSCLQKLVIAKGVWSDFSNRVINITPSWAKRTKLIDVVIPPARRNYICCIPKDTKHIWSFVIYNSTLWYIPDTVSTSFEIKGIPLLPTENSQLLTLRGHTKKVQSLTSNGSNILASCDVDGNLIIWDLDSRAIIYALKIKLYDMIDW